MGILGDGRKLLHQAECPAGSVWSKSMKGLLYSSVALLVLALAVPASAQRAGGMRSFGGGITRPAGALRTLNPGVSLTTPATTPFEQQMQQNSATQLQQAQRDLLLQNPSGLSRSEIAVGHDLNGYTSTLH
jgi:hypothetical protein